MARTGSPERFRTGGLICSHLTTNRRPVADRPEPVEAWAVVAVQQTTPLRALDLHDLQTDNRRVSHITHRHRRDGFVQSVAFAP